MDSPVGVHHGISEIKSVIPPTPKEVELKLGYVPTRKEVDQLKNSESARPATFKFPETARRPDHYKFAPPGRGRGGGGGGRLPAVLAYNQ